jgi:signal peptidase I
MRTRRRLARLAARLAAACVLGVIVLAGGALVSGRVGYVVTHGISMNPLYHQGDLVVVARAQSYQPGDIVAYHVADSHLVALHRIIGGDASGWVIKGDNNQSIDSTHPGSHDLIGRAVLHIPHGGLWLQGLTSPAVLALLAFALVGGGGRAAHTRRRRRRATMSRHATPAPRATVALRSLPPGLHTAVCVTAVAAILGVALGALAWTGPRDTLTATVGHSTRQLSFSYTATVARTAAYDGTIVRSPDPVFRRLTNTVDVQLAYRGSPGRIDVAAELSTPTGWHSTLPLATPALFTGTTDQATVRLDLDAIQARAQAAAAATGLPGSPLSVAITATIRTAGSPPFTPTLKLNLTDLQLSLAGGPNSLTTQDSVTVPRLAPAVRTLHLLGRHLAVPQARAVSVALLAAAVAAAALLVIVGVAGAPATEGAAIRRRYAPLLAHVHPLPARPNLPVVEVTEFATLARIAERAGLPVLHWARSDVETFVVMDEGSTYRYRTGDSSTVPPPIAEHTDYAGRELQPR